LESGLVEKSLHRGGLGTHDASSIWGGQIT
jgi:hypothetical protein